MKTRNRSASDWAVFASPLGFIRLILLVDWDPICLLGHVETMDEYDRYAIEVYGLLVSDVSQEDLVVYLDQTQTKSIGVHGKSSTDLASIAIKLRKAFSCGHGDQD